MFVSSNIFSDIFFISKYLILHIFATFIPSKTKFFCGLGNAFEIKANCTFIHIQKMFCLYLVSPSQIWDDIVPLPISTKFMYFC